eukprot:273178_1
MAAEKKEEQLKDTSGFKPIEAPKEIVIPTDQIKKDTVLFWIARSKNENIVVYEAQKKNNSDHYNEVVGFWLDIDPEYVKAARKKGKMDDREELNFMEKKMAYGYSLTSTEKNKKEKIYQLTIVSVPSMVMDLITDKDGKPRAVTIINGQKCYLRKIYVATKESWYGMPKVLYITITG